MRKRVLEIGCGHGTITPELVRRAAGKVVALDRDIRPTLLQPSVSAHYLAANACALPFSSGSFDLVFFANILMWTDVGRAIHEATRILQPGGALVMMEPDFGGMIEYPPELALREVWLQGLWRAGADPEVGRKLPGLCEAQDLEVWVELQGIPQPVNRTATDLLRELPLTERELATVSDAAASIERRRGTWELFVHVPYFLVVATKRRWPT
ncbi:MAG: methyltransferase domain-containing protein [Candidatus Zipacnadales bacterium]